MSDPWWYSGSARDDEDAADREPSSGSDRRSVDWSSLASGAQRLVDWATERIVVPHADHEEPAAHPECLVCRAQALMGSVRGRSAAAAAPDEADGGDRIAWIPLRDETP